MSPSESVTATKPPKTGRLDGVMPDEGEIEKETLVDQKLEASEVTSLHLGWTCRECPRTVGKFDVGHGG